MSASTLAVIGEMLGRRYPVAAYRVRGDWMWVGCCLRHPVSGRRYSIRAVLWRGRSPCVFIASPLLACGPSGAPLPFAQDGGRLRLFDLEPDEHGGRARWPERLIPWTLWWILQYESWLECAAWTEPHPPNDAASIQRLESLAETVMEPAECHAGAAEFEPAPDESHAT
ncbi:MAG: hypothetical protein JNM07_08740 [Phycisphaerae bacterium]|nr:hypothetical protein [Phycisphaerae bacterium]